MRYVIPLTPEPQRFSIVLAGRELLLAVRWMDAPEGGWLLDMADAEGVPLVSGIPLVAGCDLLEPYAYLGLGGARRSRGTEPPSPDTLGRGVDLLSRWLIMAEATSRSGERRDEGRQWLRRVLAARRAQGGRRAGAWGTARCLHRQGERAGNPQQRLDQGLQPLRGHSRADPQGIYPRHPSGRVSGQLFRHLRREHHQGGARAGGRPRSREERRRGRRGGHLPRDQRRGRRQGLQLRAGQYLAGGGLHPRRPRPRLHEGLFRQGVEPGYIPLLPGQKLPRGKVMYGMARAYMRDTARRTGTAWSFQKGKMQMVPASGYLPGEAVVLSAGTGLIGTPKANDKGIEIKCLLNPRLRIGGRVRLDNAGGAGLKAGAGREPRDVHDGLYRILSITFSGDTRGTDWYATLSCVGIDDTSQLPLDEAR